MTDQPTTLFCANHPNTETLLRCNRCEKPICIKCAVQTPTGYRCKECVRGQQKSFETATTWDLPFAFGVAAILSFIGSFIAGFMGFFILFIAPIAGTIIAEAVRFITKRRRSELLSRTVAAGALIGGLPLVFWELYEFLSLYAIINEPFIFSSLLGAFWRVLYVGLVTSTAYYRMKGIFFSR